jgi:hypothetical protein
VLDEGGTGNYNGLILSVQHRFGHNFTSSTNYTWSHCISDYYTPALGLSLYAETRFNNRAAERAPCPGADRRQVFNQTLVVVSPKYANHALRIVAGDCKMSVSAILQTGPPFERQHGAGSGIDGQRNRPTPKSNPARCVPAE